VGGECGERVTLARKSTRNVPDRSLIVKYSYLFDPLE
jgi:hypothetical protein